ncbi:hypothetical protein DEU56DRAFT_774048 [Suillus clintonianus]|uniref:uncharacterized protein n=1 Tax=Suillus clintonianus TaxID=1904413 RepID=UPI001B88123C|nr:uncharacterized protein DEU56DRAFT_774048 [Suillus clintonianus]KAG2153269.1 hypothetical protein DEU56DRAFT_774048 [Suillus clintonianus]
MPRWHRFLRNQAATIKVCDRRRCYTPRCMHCMVSTVQHRLWSPPSGAPGCHWQYTLRRLKGHRCKEDTDTGSDNLKGFSHTGHVPLAAFDKLSRVQVDIRADAVLTLVFSLSTPSSPADAHNAMLMTVHESKVSSKVICYPGWLSRWFCSSSPHAHASWADSLCLAWQVTTSHFNPDARATYWSRECRAQGSCGMLLGSL